MAERRQYMITHLATGEVSLVNATSEGQASARCCYRFPADCDVHLVRRGQEIALPFDELPLIVQRAITAAA